MAAQIRHNLIPGQRYGRLSVIGRDGHGKASFRCDCGSVVVTKYIGDVIEGRRVSCGCYRREKQPGTYHRYWQERRAANAERKRTQKAAWWQFDAAGRRVLVFKNGRFINVIQSTGWTVYERAA